MHISCRFKRRLSNLARVQNDDKTNCGLDEENEKFKEGTNSVDKRAGDNYR